MSVWQATICRRWEEGWEAGPSRLTHTLKTAHFNSSPNRLLHPKNYTASTQSWTRTVSVDIRKVCLLSKKQLNNSRVSLSLFLSLLHSLIQTLAYSLLPLHLDMQFKVIWHSVCTLFPLSLSVFRDLQTGCSVSGAAVCSPADRHHSGVHQAHCRERPVTDQ